MPDTPNPLGSFGDGTEAVKTVSVSPSSLEPHAPLADPGTSFAVGELLAGRFRIIRLIGHGGMGEVYEAEDRELHEAVALKTIRSSLAAYPRAIARFKREISLARKVTHPNVCRTFDLFFHESPS